MTKRVVLWIVCLLACLPAWGGERIEGRYFPQPNLDLEAHWAQPVLNSRGDPQVANRIIAESPFTELRLQVPNRLVGRQVRIYMTVPASIQGIDGTTGFDVEWKTQGMFRPGRARPGDRSLLFQGTVSDALVRDFIAYTFQIDARFLQGPIRFEPIYEIEEY
jgi:hypothetical protein